MFFQPKTPYNILEPQIIILTVTPLIAQKKLTVFDINLIDMMKIYLFFWRNLCSACSKSQKMKHQLTCMESGEDLIHTSF